MALQEQDWSHLDITGEIAAKKNLSFMREVDHITHIQHWINVAHHRQTQAQLALFLLSQSHEGLIVTSTSSTALHSCPSSSNSILIGCGVSGLSVSASDPGSPHLTPYCAQAKHGHSFTCTIQTTSCEDTKGHYF
ncbi:hypothetical protein ROHU_014963 [Labeo rohita]|uniref:Uncharacterized protein n=1 Tax=Labeo rohita TaxID=84645 RepID=A0A498NR78_LABRO|nr:hypothetical protein ROHU_014963 [Labeo rohita]